MLLDLIATVIAGVALAGVVMILRRLAGDIVPRWAIPAAIGAGMIAFSSWSETTWFARNSAGLPQGLTVVMAPADRSLLRPWSLIRPVVTRFAALDVGGMATSATDPALRQTDILFFERWSPTRRARIGFDCAGNRQADLNDGTVMAPDGTLSAGQWVPVDPADPLQQVACQAKGSAG
jgi:hypothetical protein